MKKRWDVLLIMVVVISVFVLLPGQTAAEDGNDLRIVVYDAYYADHDEDGDLDDAITTFAVFLPANYNETESVVVEIYVELMLPSGQAFGVSLLSKTNSGVYIEIAWINCATEPGWYLLDIEADIYLDDSEIDPGYLLHWFDPPGGDEGMPDIQITTVDQL